MKKKVIFSIAIVVMLITDFGVLVANPIISGENDVPENYLEAIESQAQGLYSKVLPLVPIYITIDSFEKEKVYYTQQERVRLKHRYLDR